MTIAPAMNWWVRIAGDELNGGGFDSTVASAGTNYADQDAAQLSLTDIVTIGSTTVTSITGGFTTAMIGNVLRIAGDAYYVIVARASTNSITVDRNTGTGVAQSGRVGGAHASLVNYSIGGAGLAVPLLASPLVPGNTINMQGSGSEDPSPGSPDYNYSTGYWNFPSGDTTDGKITLLGYNGRPEIEESGLLIHQCWGWCINHVKFLHTASLIFVYGITGYGGSYFDCIIDTNGNDNNGIAIGGGAGGLPTLGQCINNEIRNSGSTAPGSQGYGGICCPQAQNAFPCIIYGNYIHDLRTDGISYAGVSTFGQIAFNIIVNNALSGIFVNSTVYELSFFNNTINGNGGDGLEIAFAQGFIAWSACLNNIFSNNGGYGININVGTLAQNDGMTVRTSWNYNNFYNNTAGARFQISAGPNDLALDPQYTNAGAGDYSVGTNMAAVAYPGVFPG